MDLSKRGMCEWAESEVGTVVDRLDMQIYGGRCVGIEY